jgi:hypothetical protein
MKALLVAKAFKTLYGLLWNLTTGTGWTTE